MITFVAILLLLFGNLKFTRSSQTVLNSTLVLKSRRNVDRERILLGSPTGDNDRYVPLPGSVYKCFLRLPILGKQEFQLSVYEETKAHLSIAGIMSVDAVIYYNVCSESGAVSFSLPDSVVKMMKRFRTKLVEARYMPDTDSVTIKVQSPLPRHIRIELSRLFFVETSIFGQEA
jgi:hypothetical protein